MAADGFMTLVVRIGQVMNGRLVALPLTGQPSHPGRLGGYLEAMASHGRSTTYHSRHKAIVYANHPAPTAGSFRWATECRRARHRDPPDQQWRRHARCRRELVWAGSAADLHHLGSRQGQPGW
jgi:hypothetical protein